MELQIQREHFHSSVAITLIAVSSTSGISLAAILALKPDNIMYPPVSTILV